MINLDKIKADVFNELNSKYTYSGDKPDLNNIYANNCLEQAIEEIKKDFSNYTNRTTLIVSGDSNSIKKEKRKNQKKILQKLKQNVYNNTPRPEPSGFIATITFGVLAMWVLQATVGWVVSKIFNKIFIEDNT